MLTVLAESVLGFGTKIWEEQNDRQTDRQTDKVRYRVAPQLKIANITSRFLFYLAIQIFLIWIVPHSSVTRKNSTIFLTDKFLTVINTSKILM